MAAQAVNRPQEVRTMNVSKMLGATMVAGALATTGAVAGIAGAAASPTSTSNAASTTQSTTPTTPAPSQKSGCAAIGSAENGIAREKSVPEHGLRLHRELRLRHGIGIELGCQLPGCGRRRHLPVAHGPRILGRRTCQRRSSTGGVCWWRRVQPAARASRRSSPASVWLVAAVISTSVSSPGLARPPKFTTLL